MMEKVNENPLIYKIEIPLPDNPLRYLNCYVLPEGERPCIIDTGFNREECWDALKEGLDQLNIDLSKTDLFLTHVHSDHIGLAPRLFKEGCTVYMNPDDYEYFIRTKKGQAWETLEKIFYEEGYPEDEMYLQEKENHARIYAAKEIFPIIPVNDGDVIELAGRKFTAINTPGHTKGHICLYLPDEEIMFTGDHILFGISPNITHWLNMENSLNEYRKSLDKINEYSVKKAFPAHRTQKTDFATRINELKEHHNQRLEELYAIIKNNPEIDAYQVASKMTWSMRGKKFEEFSASQKWFAVGETIAHIDYLLEERRIKKYKVKDIYKYSLL